MLNCDTERRVLELQAITGGSVFLFLGYVMLRLDDGTKRNVIVR
jgi:hypothetical protein